MPKLNYHLEKIKLDSLAITIPEHLCINNSVVGKTGLKILDGDEILAEDVSGLSYQVRGDKQLERFRGVQPRITRRVTKGLKGGNDEDAVYRFVITAKMIEGVEYFEGITKKTIRVAKIARGSTAVKSTAT